MSDWRVGYLADQGFGEQRVIILAETPRSYRVCSVGQVLRQPLGAHGVRLTYRPGDVLVRKSLVRLEDSPVSAPVESPDDTK